MRSIARQARCPARKTVLTRHPAQAGRRIDVDRPSAEACPFTAVTVGRTESSCWVSRRQSRSKRPGPCRRFDDSSPAAAGVRRHGLTVTAMAADGKSGCGSEFRCSRRSSRKLGRPGIDSESDRPAVTGPACQCRRDGSRASGCRRAPTRPRRRSRLSRSRLALESRNDPDWPGAAGGILVGHCRSGSHGT